MKKIKVIDLLNMIAKGEKIPETIKIQKIEYWGAITKTVDIKIQTCKLNENIDINSKKDLNKEIEIIEEQEEIDIQGIEEIEAQNDGGTFLIDDKLIKINELIKAVKYLDNKIKEE